MRMTPDRNTQTPEVIRAERDRLLEIVTALGAVSSSPGTTQDLMDDCVRQVMQLTRADGAVLELVDGDELEYRAASGTVASHLGMRLKAATSLSGLSVAEKRIMYSQDTATDPRVDAEACRRVRARSMLVVPLLHGAEAVGVLKSVSALPSAFDQIDEYALALFAQFIGGVVARQAETDRSAQLAADMERRALSDDLTGLPNRAAWYETLGRGIARAARAGAPLAVMYLDLDGFKSANDLHGHAAGDAVLKAFAAQLRGSVRRTDFVARLGGDEFAVMVEGLADVERDVPALASKIVDAARAGIPWEGTQLVYLPSVGVAYQRGPEYDPVALMAHADEAMYRAKNSQTPYDVVDCTAT